MCVQYPEVGVSLACCAIEWNNHREVHGVRTKYSTNLIISGGKCSQMAIFTCTCMLLAGVDFWRDKFSRTEANP